jgi:sucrose phosphorylase
VLDVAAPWVILLAECNVPHHENLSYLGDAGDEAQIVYNFTLPPLVLYSIHKGDATRLSEWASGIRFVGERATFLNMTATHDGIGVRPTEGLLTEEERGQLLDLAHSHHGDVTGKRNADGSISPYELNISYFDAVNHPDSEEPLDIQVSRFMVSQAIPMAFLGIPALYIHSLIGSRNDLDGVKRTGRARSINREKLKLGNLQKELDDPASLRSRVFIEYRKLLEMRGKELAFHPDAEQEVLDMGPSVFALRRTNRKTGDSVTALHNVTGEEVEAGGETLAPYQVKWMR